MKNSGLMLHGEPWRSSGVIQSIDRLSMTLRLLDAASSVKRCASEVISVDTREHDRHLGPESAAISSR
jgi:hypothetical protein